MNIRKAQLKDAQRISQLLVIIGRLHHNGRPDIYPDGAKYGVKEVEDIILDAEKTVFVAADENDRVAGYIICFPIKRNQNVTSEEQKTLYVDDLCVDEEYQSHGIGKALLLRAKQYAEETDCKNVELNVWSFNEKAIKFYVSCGMTEQKRRMEFIL